MFDCRLYPTDAIIELTSLRKRLVDNQLGHLADLGYERDLPLLFHDGFCRPDWQMIDGLGANVDTIVTEIFSLAHAVMVAEDELESRARPN